MSKAYVYILECSDGTYYTGSTIDIEKRLHEHQNGRGANHTKKRLPVELKYLEEFKRIDNAFYREKQIQGWSRAKKEALIEHKFESLKVLSQCKNDSHYKLWLRLRSATENRLRSATENRLRSATKNLDHCNTNNNVIKTYYSNGKLLITGEYVVLDGAKAFALPTKFGQSLRIEGNKTNTINWQSYDENTNVWFECNFILDNGKILKHLEGNSAISSRLLQILKAAQELNPNFLDKNQGYNISTHLNFNRLWGLGTSSTLINNIANWANIDAYQLLQHTFGGSGYDIACAKNNTAITYQLHNTDFDSTRTVSKVDFNPSFKDHLYFVYLNTKKNSRDAITSYQSNLSELDRVIPELNSITDSILKTQQLIEFNALIQEHESIISRLTKQPTVKTLLFKDFEGGIKSLGAWGGDFILVTSVENPESYFKSKGFDTVIAYRDMIL